MVSCVVLENDSCAKTPAHIRFDDEDEACEVGVGTQPQKLNGVETSCSNKSKRSRAGVGLQLMCQGGSDRPLPAEVLKAQIQAAVIAEDYAEAARLKELFVASTGQAKIGLDDVQQNPVKTTMWTDHNGNKFRKRDKAPTT